METMMIIFMVVVCVISVFAIVITIMDLVRDYKQRPAANAVAAQPVNVQVINQTAQPVKEEPAPAKDETAAAEITEKAEEPEEPEEQPAEEPAPQQVVAVPEGTNVVAVPEGSNVVAVDENSVVFSSNKETLEEKYLALPAELKGYYDEIVKYAFEKEGVKRVKNDRYEEYKIRSTRLVRLSVKRGNVIAQFILLNSEFKNYISENNVSVKQAPVTMTISDKAAVEAAKNCIDIAEKSHKDLVEYRKEKRKEKRRAANAAEKAEKAEADNAEAETLDTADKTDKAE